MRTNHMILAAVALAATSTPAFSAISFTDDFQNDEWKTAAGGSFAALPGGWRNLPNTTGPTANGWEYFISPWGGAQGPQLVFEYTGPSASTNGVFTNDGGATLGTGTGQVLSIRKGNYYFHKFSMADVVGGSVTVEFDYWFTNAVVPLGNLNYGVFETLPTVSQDKDWTTTGSYVPIAATQGGTGHANQTFDVSTFTGTEFYVAIQKSGNSSELGGIDDFSITSIPEPSAAALLGLAGLMLGRRRRVRCPV